MPALPESKILEFSGIRPRIHPSALITEGATVIGNARLDALASVWYGTVIRADVNSIYVGVGTNIQDNTVLHAETGTFSTVLGNFVTVGHSAVVHGCIVKDFSLIGIGAVVMNGAEVGPFSIVGAGALVPEGRKIPPYTLAVGVPARPKRALGKEEVRMLERSAVRYIILCAFHIHTRASHYLENFMRDVKRLLPENLVGVFMDEIRGRRPPFEEIVKKVFD